MKVKSLTDIESTVTDEEILQYRNDSAKNAIAQRKFMSQLANGFSEIEQQETRVSDLVMNSFTFASFRKLSRDVLGAETSAERIRRGLLATVWGARMWVDRQVENDEIENDEIRFYGEGDQELEREFPDIAESIRFFEEGESEEEASPAESQPQPEPSAGKSRYEILRDSTATRNQIHDSCGLNL